MPLIFGFFFGLVALLTQPQQLPVDFIHGALTRSEPVNTFEAGFNDGFIGLEWVCEENEARLNGKIDLTPTELATEQETTRNDLDIDGEVCYAGLSSVFDLEEGSITFDFVTGP